MTGVRVAACATVCILAFMPAACGPADAGGEPTQWAATSAIEAVSPANERPAQHVDSIFPIEEEIRRFRGSTEDPGAMRNAASSLDDLVARFEAAIEAADSATLRSIVIDRTEFAWLYYPHTTYTRKPYELAPGLVWFQLQQNSEKGIGRALSRYGGTHGVLGPHRCESEPQIEGPNTVWRECAIVVSAADGSAGWKRVFGPILQRDGLFKFISYANDL